MSLDAPLSDAQLRAIAASRTQRGDQHVADVCRIVTPALPPAKRVHAVTADLNGHARRVFGELLPGGGLHLVIPIPPRTKKNGTTLGIKQGPAYRVYRDFVIAMLAPLLGPLGLPLHPMPLNLCALYYVDTKGKRADLFGLHQGLADALENAEVVVDDHWFRTTDGSRIIADDPNPRVDVTITPLKATVVSEKAGRDHAARDSKAPAITPLTSPP